MKQSTKTQVVVIAYEGVSAFHLSVPSLVFRDAFVESKGLFELRTCSLTGGKVKTSSGYDVVLEHDISALGNADIVIVPGWPSELPQVPASLVAKLRQAHANGAMLVGLCLGAFVIAATGLLENKTATTHWAFAEHFQQTYPQIQVQSRSLFIEHEKLITSAGTVAAIDCCLQIVRRLCGQDIASRLARVMVTPPFRSGDQQQYVQTPIVKRPQLQTGITRVLVHVAETLNEPHDINKLAKRCAMSRRTFTRQFNATYGCSFGQWLLNQRLKLAQQILEQTSLAIVQVAEQAGFGSEGIFRKHFKQAFNITPSKWREQFKGDE